jgi:hypothetical protein
MYNSESGELMLMPRGKPFLSARWTDLNRFEIVSLIDGERSLSLSKVRVILSRGMDSKKRRMSALIIQ